ncbi:hypothetical protein ACGFYU_33810 [Streptomyces sp. NPDC048337]|uniref:hypothetical protein n=1 Tax=Streptomyces sp. NPDC048337 TaxID=3365535 RepID=UPI0037181A72
MSYDLHARSKRRIARLALALTSAAFVSGAIALPASAATAPAARPSVVGVLSDTPPDDVDFGGGGAPEPYIPPSSARGGDGGSGGKDLGGIGGNGGDHDPSSHRDPHGAYGPTSCEQGYVWRDSYDGDNLCVTPGERQEAHDGRVNREPGGGAYGPSTCKQGYVWRDSYDGDNLCVTPAERDAARPFWR